MGIAFAATAAALAAAYGLIVVRARREWRAGAELSPATALAISATWALTGALLALALAWRPWPLALASVPAVAGGAMLALAGAALAGAGFAAFGSARGLYGLERGELLRDGVYRVTRNPQYVGMGLVVAGIAVAARSGLALAVTGAYCLAARAWLAIEEEHLEREFGAEWEAYRERAPRLLGRRGG